MSTTGNSEFTADIFALDPHKLADKAIKGLRTAFALSGAVALVLGIVLLLWPTKTLAVVAVLGLLVLVAGVIMLRNAAATGEALLLFTVIFIGIGWIIEGIMAIAEAGKGPTRTWAIVFGVLSVLAGIAVLVVPVWTAQWLLLLTAIMLIVLGVVGLVRAFTFGKQVLQAS